jgi:hypothetical protein
MFHVLYTGPIPDGACRSEQAAARAARALRAAGALHAAAREVQVAETLANRTQTWVDTDGHPLSPAYLDPPTSSQETVESATTTDSIAELEGDPPAAAPAPAPASASQSLTVQIDELRSDEQLHAYQSDRDRPSGTPDIAPGDSASQTGEHTH